MKKVLNTFLSVSLGIWTSAGFCQTSTTDFEISQALHAAPTSIASGAGVARMDAKGNMTQLRPGSNGWTCLAHQQDPLHPDTIEHHPACFDKYGLEWAEDYAAGRKPNPQHVGYSYMLQGGSSWSNTDPAADKLAPGQKDFIRMPPHIMILNAALANTSGFPSGEAIPDTHKPFVMFGGTPYALLIIPLS
jgi:hypothetical protein